MPAVGGRGREVTFEQVRAPVTGLVRHSGAHPAPPAVAGDARGAHQPGDPLTLHSHAALRGALVEVGGDPG